MIYVYYELGRIYVPIGVYYTSIQYENHAFETEIQVAYRRQLFLQIGYLFGSLLQLEHKFLITNTAVRFGHEMSSQLLVPTSIKNLAFSCLVQVRTYNLKRDSLTPAKATT